MESMVDKNFWSNKKVLITGNTGFKGSWCHVFLDYLGANVLGYSREINTKPSNYNEICNDLKLKTIFGDILDKDKLEKTFYEFKPDIVIHMAAQAIVKTSYSDPFDTFNTNVIGTLNILEASKSAESVKVIINVTSDKCYENDESNKPFVETDRFGGKDMYSASKACAEILANAYNESFLSSSENKLKLASVRAGNVIGGGDWSPQRLIPDIIRSIDSSDLIIRNPMAIRPWQHVLDPVYGYIKLAKELYISDSLELTGGWNFGPDENSSKSVEWILKEVSKYIKNFNYKISEKIAFKESNYLRLNSSKANTQLTWFPVWAVDDALKYTINWYVDRKNSKHPTSVLMIKDIKEYILKLRNEI